MILQVGSTGAASGREMNTPTLIIADGFGRVRMGGVFYKLVTRRAAASSAARPTQRARPFHSQHLLGLGALTTGQIAWMSGEMC